MIILDFDLAMLVKEKNKVVMKKIGWQDRRLRPTQILYLRMEEIKSLKIKAFAFAWFRFLGCWLEELKLMKTQPYAWA